MNSLETENSFNIVSLDSTESLEEYRSYLHDESKLSADVAREIFFPRSTEETSNFFI